MYLSGVGKLSKAAIYTTAETTVAAFSDLLYKCGFAEDLGDHELTVYDG
jgi:hypothetical protein